MNIFLIGYRGSGKSTVGQLLAQLLDWPFVDTDEQVELLAGYTIPQIFADNGEQAFRDWESSVILALAGKDHQVISLGGGAPLSADNRDVIRRHGICVHLTAPAETLWKRICKDEQAGHCRPALTGLDGINEVRALLEQREATYNACADYTVDTADLSPQQVAEKIANWWDPVDK